MKPLEALRFLGPRAIGGETCILAFLGTVLLFPAPAKSQTAADSVPALLSRAYEALNVDVAHALPLFERVVLLDPANITARRQLGTAYISAGRPEEAVAQLSRAQEMFPSDTIALQMAYLLNSLKRTGEAYDMFRTLEWSSDPGIREKARVASVVLSGELCSAGFPWWGRVYASPFYESRFDDLIVSASLYAGHYLASSRAVSVYGVVQLSHDTRSTGGPLPVIFSDNFLLAGGGVRLQPFAGFLVDVQAGFAHDLIERAGQGRTRGDFRTLAVYGTGIYPELAVPDRIQLPFKPLVDLYLSTGYYSRYENSIAYNQLRAGVRAVEWKYASLDLYGRADLVVDTRREFFNNIIEGSVGLRFVPYRPWGVNVLAEIHWGAYWGPEVPMDRSYRTLRLFFITDIPLCF